MPGFGCWLFLALSWDIYTLREIPEEAIHVSEYGILGLLVYRALTHRVRDFSIYLMAALVVAMIGVIDEYIQWLTPSRVFDLRDIRTNAIAGALSQLAIFLGLRPSIIHGMPAAINWSRLCYLGIAALALLALGFMNTPQRIAWYATNLPPLAYLMDSKSVMVEYGYRYEDPDTGIFRSRFPRLSCSGWTSSAAPRSRASSIDIYAESDTGSFNRSTPCPVTPTRTRPACICFAASFTSTGLGKILLKNNTITRSLTAKTRS